MNRTLTFLTCLSLSLCGEAWAQDKNTNNDSGYSSQQNDAASLGTVADDDQNPLEAFRASKETTLPTMEGGRAGPMLTLALGQELVVLEKKWDEHYGSLIHFGLDSDNGPTDIWVQEQDLVVRDIVPYAFTDEEGDQLEILKKMTYCYRYVKNYLLKTGQVKSYLPGGSAYQAASILPKFGFHRTGHAPMSASNGEVCVYSGGPQGNGHIEVKRNGKWWYGYGFINHPMTGRHFIACFLK